MNASTQARRTRELGRGGEPLGFEAGDANLYRYVGDDPTNATDPSGLWKKNPDDNDFWKLDYGKLLSDRLDGAEVYLTKTIDDLTDKLDKLAVSDDDKRMLRSLLGEIKKRVETLVIRPVLAGRLDVAGSQATPFGGNGMYLSIFNIINIRNSDGTGYYSKGDGKHHYWVSPYHELAGKEKMDPFSIAMLGIGNGPLVAGSGLGSGSVETLEGDNIIKTTTQANKGLPTPQVTLWDSKQLAALMANEILHHLSDQKTVEGWEYHPENKVQVSVDYTIIAVQKGSSSTSTGVRLGYDSAVYDLWEFESTLGVLGKPENRPTFSGLLKSDAIFQAIYYDEWPTVAK